METRHQVFVYGTLMRGEHHHDLLREARLLKAAETPASYELVLIDYYPALLEGGSQHVQGELYEVDDRTLAQLDELEEIPTLYRRESITLACGSVALAYVLPRELAGTAPVIPSGDFRRRPRS